MIHTALDHLTVIEVGEPVVNVAAGSAAFKIEWRENKVFIEPTEPGVSTNLFIWTASSRLNYEPESAGEVGRMDFAIDYPRPTPPPAAKMPNSSGSHVGIGDPPTKAFEIGPMLGDQPQPQQFRVKIQIALWIGRNCGDVMNSQNWLLHDCPPSANRKRRQANYSDGVGGGAGTMANTSRLSGKVVLVTGASKGIGSGIAQALAAEGARVAVNYTSDRGGAERVAQAIIDSGGKAIAVGADVSKAADVARLFQQVDSAFGRLDVLVNNAGVFRFGAFAEISEQDFHVHYNINVLGMILTVQEAIKRFGADGGSIINLSSIVGSHPVPRALLYASTKGAIETLTRGLALELAPRKIRVNAIAPGHTETEGNVAAGTFEGGAGAALAAHTPLGRIGRVTDIAPLAVFLASDESAWITGEVIRAAGGLVVAR